MEKKINKNDRENSLLIHSLPLVSVAMTTYNGENFLAQQLDSLVAQNYSLFEIIICDDNSTDSTAMILKSYEHKPGIDISIYHNKENLGYIKNFEKAVSHCRGEYIVFCDQDDIWEPDKIAVQVRALIAEDALAIFSDAFLVDVNARDLGMSLWEAVVGRKPPSEIDYREFYLKNCVTGCTLMIHRQLLNSALPFPKSVQHDWWLAYHAAYQKRLVLTEQKLVHYRQHSHNVYGAGLSRIRKKSLSYYLKYQYQKFDLYRSIKRCIDECMLCRGRLKAMMDFEKSTKSGVSDELICLNNWVDDRAFSRNMSEYSFFYQSDSPMFRFFGGRIKMMKNISQMLRSIFFEFLRDAFKIALFLSMIALVIYYSNT